MKALTLSKESILKILNDFPQEVVLEDFIDGLIITAKINMAREQVRNGEYLTEKEMDDEIAKWN